MRGSCSHVLHLEKSRYRFYVVVASLQTHIPWLKMREKLFLSESIHTFLQMSSYLINCLNYIRQSKYNNTLNCFHYYQKLLKCFSLQVQFFFSLRFVSGVVGELPQGGILIYEPHDPCYHVTIFAEKSFHLIIFLISN